MTCVHRRFASLLVQLVLWLQRCWEHHRHHLSTTPLVEHHQHRHPPLKWWIQSSGKLGKYKNLHNTKTHDIQWNYAAIVVNCQHKIVNIDTGSSPLGYFLQWKILISFYLHNGISNAGKIPLHRNGTIGECTYHWFQNNALYLWTILYIPPPPCARQDILLALCHTVISPLPTMPQPWTKPMI